MINTAARSADAAGSQACCIRSRSNASQLCLYSVKGRCCSISKVWYAPSLTCSFSVKFLPRSLISCPITAPHQDLVDDTTVHLSVLVLAFCRCFSTISVHTGPWKLPSSVGSREHTCQLTALVPSGSKSTSSTLIVILILTRSLAPAEVPPESFWTFLKVVAVTASPSRIRLNACHISSPGQIDKLFRIHWCLTQH